MTLARRAGLLAALALVVTWLAACGGDEDSTAALSCKEYLDRPAKERVDVAVEASKQVDGVSLAGDERWARTLASSCRSRGEDTLRDVLGEFAYIDDVNKAQNDFVKQATAVGTGASSPDELAQRLEDLAARIEALVDDLEKIDPPEQVQDEHDRLEETLADYSSAVEKLPEALSSSDEEKLKTAAADLQSATTKVGRDFDATIDAINRDLGAKSSG